jgi:plastocyanin
MKNPASGLAHRRVVSPAAALALLLLVAAPVIAANAAVSIAGVAFNPSSVTIDVGDTVTWTNNDGLPHTVTADDTSFDSGVIAGGATFPQTFPSAGTVNYHCTIHPTMTGTVVVRAAAATAPPATGPKATEPNTATSGAREEGRSASAPLMLVVALAIIVGLVVAGRRIAPLEPSSR